VTLGYHTPPFYVTPGSTFVARTPHAAHAATHVPRMATPGELESFEYIANYFSLRDMTREGKLHPARE